MLPAWMLTYLVPLAIDLLKTYGIPQLEAKFPFLTPLVNEVLALLNGTVPSEQVKAAAEHFNSLKS